MNSVEVLPDPARLIAGLRDTGYEFNTAIADIIDNAIAAGATFIDTWIEMDYEGSVTVSISDNGSGMTYEKLVEAMKYGSPPRPDRRSLGKFGLGLKTASTAFCRKLSVITRNSGTKRPLKACWDLDHVATTGKWDLLLPAPTKEEIEYLDRAATTTSGTLIRWENLDRLLKDYHSPGGTFAAKALGKKISSLHEHVAMIYQRFLDPKDKREKQKIQIQINGKKVKAWDPFCSGESELVADETKEVATVDSDDVVSEFTIKAYVLPRKEEFSGKEAADRARLSNDYQGIYIYRENRLIHSQDWLGIYSKEPHGTLLRVEFSFDATLDDAFQVDIKKSKISLNEELYNWLAEEFLPAPRRAANDRYRKGLRKITEKAAKLAHDASNTAIAEKEADIDQANVRVVNRDTGQVEVTNEHGKTRLKLKLSSAKKPGEVHVQPVNTIDDGLLWQPALVDGHQAVQINSGHDFYQKVYLPNIVSTEPSTITVQGIDSLLWALGVAELRAVSESTRTHFSEMRFEISRILRKLVEHLPEPSGSTEEVQE